MVGVSSSEVIVCDSAIATCRGSSLRSESLPPLTSETSSESSDSEGVVRKKSIRFDDAPPSIRQLKPWFVEWKEAQHPNADKLDIEKFVHELSEGIEVNMWVPSVFGGSKRNNGNLFTTDGGNTVCWIQTQSPFECTTVKSQLLLKTCLKRVGMSTSTIHIKYRKRMHPQKVNATMAFQLPGNSKHFVACLWELIYCKSHYVKSPYN